MTPKRKVRPPENILGYVSKWHCIQTNALYIVDRQQARNQRRRAPLAPPQVVHRALEVNRVPRILKIPVVQRAVQKSRIPRGIKRNHRLPPADTENLKQNPVVVVVDLRIKIKRKPLESHVQQLFIPPSLKSPRANPSPRQRENLRQSRKPLPLLRLW